MLETYVLSRRSLDLLEQVAGLGIYGESPAEVGARFVDQGLKGFVERNMEPPMTPEARNAIMDRTMTEADLVALQLPKVDSHDGRYEGTINDSLSTQSLYLLDRLAELEIYGETSAEVGGRFVDEALKEFVERPRFVINGTPISRFRFLVPMSDGITECSFLWERRSFFFVANDTAGVECRARGTYGLLELASTLHSC